VTQRALEPLERFLIAFRRGLDATIRQIPHPAVHAFARGDGFHKPPKADALHTTADDVLSRDAHSG